MDPEGLVSVLNANHFEVVETDWIIGMLAYSCQLHVQCWKGLLENKGIVGKNVLRCISLSYQKFMEMADKITPEHIGRDNAALYVMLAGKVHNTPTIGL